MKRLITILAVLVASACDLLGPPEPAELVIEVLAHRSDDPFADSAAFAGLAIEVNGIGQQLELVVSDFRAEEGGGGQVYRVSGVPDSGMASLKVKVHQGGEVAAEGVLSWALQPRVEWWELLIFREVFPAGWGVEGSLEHPGCFIASSCHQVQRFPVRADLANERDEGLWLVLYLAHLDREPIMGS